MKKTISLLFVLMAMGVSAQNPLDIPQIMTPVKLIDFTGYPVNDSVVLEWSTGSEEQNAYFVIESSDTGEFTRLDSIPGSGTTTHIKRYETQVAPHRYYRLSQVDLDGTREELRVIAVTLETQVVWGHRIPADDTVLAILCFDQAGRIIDINSRGFRIIRIVTDRRSYAFKSL